MRIAYIGSFDRIYDEEGIARSLEFLGHEVTRHEESKTFRPELARIVSDRPDFVLMAKLKIDMYDKEWLMQECKKRGILTVVWVPDLYIGIARERLLKHDPIFKADLVCTPDGGNDDVFQEYGVNHKLLRQGIYHEDVGRGERVFGNWPDLAFVGCLNTSFKYRTDLMNHLKMRYKDQFEWYGRENTHQYRGSHLSDMIASVKIIIGDSVYSPYYWSNRIYETIGRGGFIIHPNIPGLEQEFEYYEHFIPYDYGNIISLYEKVDHFLGRPAERQKISEAGMEHVRQNHTLINRCKQLLHYVEKS
jgi:hypothetical protein